ncbi:Replication factor Mcm10 C-terminal, partial [Trinorchestia longiramus]
MPVKPCGNCEQTSWRRVAMGKAKKGPTLDSEVLCLRGNEQKYFGGHAEKAYLHIDVLEGKWHSQNKFFLFLSKFGFQKTNSHDGALSEGFIFGNITTLNEADNSNNPQQSGTGKPKFNATLVLLPRQFFFNFYGNSSTAALNSPNNYDTICQAMFKDVLREAYDAHCHDDGDEDFLRHVPCPVGQLCVDEDNPKNVIPNSQLTYAIKDVNNPRFWYLSLVACGLNESCGWQYSGPVSVSYHLTLVNGKPPAKDHDFFAYHFSCEQQDIGQLIVVCLLVYVFFLLPLQFHATCKMRLRVLEVFLCALCLQTLGLVFATTAQLIMGASGRWVEGLVVSGQVCTLLCEAVFLLLLVLLARGWAVTATTGHHTLGLYSIWGSYAAVTLMLYAWNL